MTFNSWTFLYFLGVVLPVYYCLSRRAQNVFLLVASYVFYGWWDWRFLSLLWASTAVDFVVGQRLGKTTTAAPRTRRAWLLVSLAANLGILGFFKYMNFFAESAVVALREIGLAIEPITLNIVLPVGISFYTFQTLAYTIDVYRGRIRPTTDLVDFALYVAFFPQLVAGPIERAEHLLPAFANPRRVTGSHLTGGVGLILTGLLRKVAIADYLSGTVTEAFSSPQNAPPLKLLIGLYSFALVIYGDFAGYSDIARGTSRLLGVELMVNFQRPYAASSITEFWRRWHISLSTWLRDYLYIPLGGNRHGTVRTYVNLMLTMLLGGLWHGANWRFIIWGGLHGISLAVHKLWLQVGSRQSPTVRTKSPAGVFLRLSSVLATFHLVCLTWIFFRADTLADSWAYVGGLLRFSEYEFSNLQMIAAHRLIMAFGITLLIDGCKAVLESKGWAFADIVPVWQGVAFGTALLVLFLLGDRSYAPFIYFQF
ncbi:MAG: MBOAT family protein [Planctomycetaceae bacterium]